MELNRLPDELLHELFSYLDLSTLLTTCALVCKRWAELIHQMRIKELSFGSRYFRYPISYSWSHPFVPLDDRYLVWTPQTFNNTNPFFDFPFIEMFKNLKRLRLNSTLRSEFDFSKLNQLSALEELHLILFFSQPTEKTLKLPRLRVLSLTLDAVHPSKLTVDCPVKILFIRYYLSNEEGANVAQSPIDLLHPDALEEINLRNSNSLNWSAFKNVRIFRDYGQLRASTAQSEVFSANYLEIFPNLQELHYQVEFHTSPTTESAIEEIVNTARTRISDALATKRQQNLPVKIFFQGIQLEGQRFFESLELKTMNDLPALQWEHYEHLATNLYYYDNIDYRSLENYFGDSLPADLFSRFTCVNTVTATRIKHLDQFTRFLKQCRYLCKLVVELDSVDQTFCDQLHVNCRFLRQLTFNDRKKEENNAGVDNQRNNLANALSRKLAITDNPPFKKFNFNFLAKQTNLLAFQTDELDMQTAVRCLEVAPSKMYQFNFTHLKCNISITGLKRKNSYAMQASFYVTPKMFDSIKFHQLSIDELASDLEFLRKKIEGKLALKSKRV